MVSPLPPCAWLCRFCADSPALRGLPSSSLVRPCDRSAILSCGWASFRVLPGRLARLHGRLSWVFRPRASAHFQRSARERSPTLGLAREELARAFAFSRRLLPRGLPGGSDGRRLRVTSRALAVFAAEVACAVRCRVCFAAQGRVLFRGCDPLSRFLVRRRTARRESTLSPSQARSKHV